MDDAYLVQVGRAKRYGDDRGLTFVRVIHRPSGKERQVIGIGDQTVEAAVTRL